MRRTRRDRRSPPHENEAELATPDGHEITSTMIQSSILLRQVMLEGTDMTLDVP
jgi:hypothetical protein